MPTDRDVARETAHYPPADITPAEFEEFVVELLSSVSPLVEGLEIILHDKVAAADGVYDFDATVRFSLGGMHLLVLVEAKRHKNPIKRELVQVLHGKLRSVGAHKAVMIATAPYQRGALEYAKAHGIALATVTEGRFIYETRSAEAPPPLTRGAAMEHFGLPLFVAHAYAQGRAARSTSVTLLDLADPRNVAETLLRAGLDEDAG